MLTNCMRNHPHARKRIFTLPDIHLRPCNWASTRIASKFIPVSSLYPHTWYPASQRPWRMSSSLCRLWRLIRRLVRLFPLLMEWEHRAWSIPGPIRTRLAARCLSMAGSGARLVCIVWIFRVSQVVERARCMRANEAQSYWILLRVTT